MRKSLNPIELTLFSQRLSGICREMGLVLQQAAFSPNIKDRQDYSCALFDATGELMAQAAHIPVHLGSMAFAMGDLVDRFDWQEGDVMVLNDPFLGGTHLPDVTVICPVFLDGGLIGFAASRAHHANIGADTPGSMPVSSRLEEEGVLIPPTRLREQPGASLTEQLRSLLGEGFATAELGDFAAQISANRLAVGKLAKLVSRNGDGSLAGFLQSVRDLHDYGEKLAREGLRKLPEGVYLAEDRLDDDGFANRDLRLALTLTIRDGSMAFDFSATAGQVRGNVNCPLPVTVAAAFYVLRCLLPDHTPACAGIFRPVEVLATEGSLLNARRPAAVAAGNVETSMRVVDVILRALQQAIPAAVPAACQGTMNNVAMGSRQNGRSWDYYETLAGGYGASTRAPGRSAVHAHMTNTKNTPVESLEQHYPLRVNRYALRRGSGGEGRHQGGDGLIREYEFLERAEVTLLTERRSNCPWGLEGGDAGRPGANYLNDRLLPAKVHLRVSRGDRLRIETPGGGGFGPPCARADSTAQPE